MKRCAAWDPDEILAKAIRSHRHHPPCSARALALRRGWPVGPGPRVHAKPRNSDERRTIMKKKENVRPTCPVIRRTRRQKI